ncbi:MAG TPA: hypothetical protein VF094_03145 [Gaiellaceae bacterium]
MLRSGLAAAVLAVLGLCACGGHSRHAATPSPACRHFAAVSVDDGRLLLVSYAGNPTPADEAMHQLRDDLAEEQLRGCAPDVLGAALQKLAPRQRAQLLSHLPGTWVVYFRQAVACAAGRTPAAGCTRAATQIVRGGTGKPGGSPYPIAPG